MKNRTIVILLLKKENVLRNIPVCLWFVGSVRTQRIFLRTPLLIFLERTHSAFAFETRDKKNLLATEIDLFLSMSKLHNSVMNVTKKIE